MLKVLKNERVIMVDLDDTLVMHHHDKTIPGKYVKVLDPLDDCRFIELLVNEPMVRLVKEEIARGSQICFWSRGGWEWAFNVLSALDFGQQNYTEIMLVMTKPFAYFDDSDVSSWMKDRVYLKPDVPYKV